MRGFEIHFENRDFPKWSARVRKFLKESKTLHTVEAKENPSNWWNLLAAIKAEDDAAYSDEAIEKTRLNELARLETERKLLTARLRIHDMYNDLSP